MENQLEQVKIKLVKPSDKYKNSFIEAAKEFEAEGDNIYGHSERNKNAFKKSFENLLIKIKESETGENLPEGYVAQTQLWLIEGDKFIGRVNIRHELNDALMEYGGHIGYAIRPSERKKGYGTKILELALPFAKRLGLSRVLITCDDDNLGSAKIIEKNRGVFENTALSPEGNVKRRYWIEIK